MQQGGIYSLGHPLVEWAKHNLRGPSMKVEKYHRFLHDAACRKIIVDGR